MSHSKRVGRAPLELAVAALCVLATTARGQITPTPVITPPPVPAVAPDIVYPYEADGNGNRIDDVLDAQIAKISGWNTGTRVVVELLFRKQVTQQQINTFLAMGGTITHLYTNVSYGWTGTIPLSAVSALPIRMGTGFLFVSSPRQVKMHLDEATRNGRVRPIWVPGFAGSSGYSGSSSTTVAIVDTGVDNSHTDLAGRMVWWKDYTSSAHTSPVDYVGHGSHVAGIALGTGSASGASPTQIHFTNWGDGSSLSSGYFYPTPSHVPAGSVTVTSTATWTGGGSAYLGFVGGTDGDGPVDFWAVNPKTGTSPLTMTATFTASSGNCYSNFFSPYSGSVGTYAVSTTITYAGVGDGYNTLRGVAPGAQWAGCKVFADGSSGAYTSDIGAAIDDMVAQRSSLHVKVLNMSLGGTTDATFRGKVNTAVANGIVVCCSAGNGSPGTISDPGSAGSAITVGATDTINALTYYSSYWSGTPGTGQDYKPDVLAPGGSDRYAEILSVDSNTSDGGVSTFGDVFANDYTGFHGTSMASPFVAGASALVIQALEDIGITWDFGSTSTAYMVKTLLCATATETNAVREASAGYNPTLGRAATPKDVYEGYGIVNPDAAIEALRVAYTYGTSVQGTAAGGYYDKRAWGYNLALTASQKINIGLTVPSTGDFDVYLYSSTPGTNGNPVILASSTNAGSGAAESFSYTPTANSTAFLVVKRVAGSGTWTLLADYASKNPLPTLTSINPSTAAAGSGAFALSLTGTNFVSGSTVQWNGSSRPTTYSSSTGLTAAITAADVASAGTASVTVVNPPPGGGTSNALTFTITGSATPTFLWLQNVSAAPGRGIRAWAWLYRTDTWTCLANKSLTLKIDGTAVSTATTGAEGGNLFTYSVPQGTSLGTHAMVVTFAGDANYTSSSGSATLTVTSTSDTTVWVQPARTAQGQNVILTARLQCASDTYPLSSKTLAFKLDGVNVGSGATNSDGFATALASISGGILQGSHTITATFAGDSSFNPSTADGTLTVGSMGDTYLWVGSPTGTRGGGVRAWAWLWRLSDWTSLANKQVAFSIDGSAVQTITTNADGGALLTYTIPSGMSLGTHAITAAFAGDGAYNGSTASGTLTVSDTAATGIYVQPRSTGQGQAVLLSAQLYTAADLAPVSGQSLTFSIDGVSAGSGATDPSGYANLVASTTGLSVGSHAISVAYAGLAPFLASSGTGTLTVSSTGNTFLWVGSASGSTGQTVHAWAWLWRTSDWTNLSGENIVFKIDGNVVSTVATGSTGGALFTYTIDTSLTQGSHTLTAEFAGDSSYSGSSAAGTLTVTP